MDVSDVLKAFQVISELLEVCPKKGNITLTESNVIFSVRAVLQLDKEDIKERLEQTEITPELEQQFKNFITVSDMSCTKGGYNRTDRKLFDTNLDILDAFIKTKKIKSDKKIDNKLGEHADTTVPKSISKSKDESVE